MPVAFSDLHQRRKLSVLNPTCASAVLAGHKAFVLNPTCASAVPGRHYWRHRCAGRKGAALAAQLRPSAAPAGRHGLHWQHADVPGQRHQCAAVLPVRAAAALGVPRARLRCAHRPRNMHSMAASLCRSHYVPEQFTRIMQLVCSLRALFMRYHVVSAHAVAACDGALMHLCRHGHAGYLQRDHRCLDLVRCSPPPMCCA